MIDWEKIFEYGAILITGIGVVFACGKNKQSQDEIRKDVEELKHIVFPDDPDREIIRQRALDRQCAQIEKLLRVMEENLIQKIELVLRDYK